MSHTVFRYKSQRTQTQLKRFYKDRIIWVMRSTLGEASSLILYMKTWLSNKSFLWVEQNVSWWHHCKQKWVMACLVNFSELVRYQLLQLQSSLSAKLTLRVVWKDLSFSSGQDQAKYPSQRLPKNFHNLGKFWHGCRGRGIGGGYKWIKAIWSIQLRTITYPWQASLIQPNLSSHLIPGLEVFLKVKSLGRTCACTFVSHELGKNP